MRYTVYISFHTTSMGEPHDNILQDIKTKKEALSYKKILDDTVQIAWIRDNVTKEVTWWKGM